MCNILYLYTRSVAQKFTTSIMNIGNTFSIDKEFDDMMNRKKILSKIISVNLIY